MSLFFPMVIFSISMSISPGPVNIIAMTSGLNFGFRNSLKFVSGATFGFISLLLLIGVGLGEVNNLFPEIVELLRYVGCAYIFYIGFQIIRTTQVTTNHENEHNIPTFRRGWFMQWLNPKAWIACLAGCSAFNVYNSEKILIQFLTIYFFFCFIGIASWALLGQKIKVWVDSEGRVKIYNSAMGSILCLLAIAILVN